MFSLVFYSFIHSLIHSDKAKDSSKVNNYRYPQLWEKREKCSKPYGIYLFFYLVLCSTATSVKLLFVYITLIKNFSLFSCFNCRKVSWISGYELFVPMFLDWKTLGERLTQNRNSTNSGRKGSGVLDPKHVCVTLPCEKTALSLLVG